MKALGKAYKDAEASTGDFKRLPAGGYIARILAVKDVADKSYLAVEFDIAEGEFKAFYGDDWGKEHPSAHTMYRSYKETALPMFKGFLRAVDQSNGTKFEQDAVNGLAEQQLVGRAVGIVVGYEEYQNDRGEIRERAKVTAVRSVDKIRSGDFKVPELKKLDLSKSTTAASPVEGFVAVNEADLPF